MGLSEQELVRCIDDASASGIARTVGRLVTSGRLEPGDQLPTVRSLARALGISPMTVSAAWQALVADGLLLTRGRGGTTVLRRDRTPPATRQRRVSALGDRLAHDLGTGAPDPRLLPDLSRTLARVRHLPLVTSYQAEPVIPALEQLMRRCWPFPPESLTVVDGAGDALDRICALVVRRGSRIMVEDPTYPLLLDLLEAAGAELLPLTLDDQGIEPGSLRQALQSEPVALFLQPRAHNPTGTSMSTSRAVELSDLLKSTDVLVVEDDHAGDIALARPISLGCRRPAATIRIASFSKSHGPDLRLAAVGGAREILEALVDRRFLGPGWSSRLLQHFLVDLLTDGAAVKQVRTARRTYDARRRAVLTALTHRGIRATGYDGINVWIDVADESFAVGTLAAAGIGVARGTPFEVRSGPTAHVRLTISDVDHGVASIADAVARAASAPTRRAVR